MKNIHYVVGLLLTVIWLFGCTNLGRFQINKLAAELQNTEVQVLEKDNQLVLLLASEVTFQPGATKLKPSSYPLLIKIADILMKDYPNANIKIAAYTDTSGSPKRNRSISITRARAVGGYLRYRGINRDRIDAVGFGEDHPIASNTTSEGRAKNRRIEIYIN